MSVVTFLRNILPLVQHSNQHTGSNRRATCHKITSLFCAKCSFTNVRATRSNLDNICSQNVKTCPYVCVMILQGDSFKTVCKQKTLCYTKQPWSSWSLMSGISIPCGHPFQFHCFDLYWLSPTNRHEATGWWVSFPQPPHIAQITLSSD